VVAVHSVHAHVERAAEHPLVLRIPGERVTLEAMEQRGESGCPVAEVEVDGIDAGVGEVGGPSFGTGAHAP
jgi:hypothetical protein